MLDQDKLLECMEEIKAIARSQDNRLTTEEIKRYLNEMDFGESQLAAVYQYLAANNITIEGYLAPIPKETDKTEKPLSKAARNLAQYRQEVSSLTQHDGQTLALLWTEYLAGQNQAREKLIHAWLSQVINIAEGYKTRGVALDEVIAEGNLGVLTAMEMIRQDVSSFQTGDCPDMKKIDSLIEKEIRYAMETMIDNSTETSDKEYTLLAKTNLLHEAAKHLAEENARTPSPEELAEYTRLPLSEVYDIMRLSKK
jgi:RNA polymerase primary sigma factor